METNLIFVAGVHGVGKSTFCSELMKHQKNCSYLSASKLISAYKVNAFTSSKKVEEISDNQNVLVNAYRTHKPTSLVTLLDGHFCLFDSSYTPTAVSQDVFRELDTRLVILLTASIETISQRMVARGIQSLSNDQLFELQELEIESAKKVSRYLSVPLLQFTEKQLSGNLEYAMSETMESILKCEFY